MNAPATRQPLPQQRLPAGVTSELWDYIHSDQIAEDYDDYFALNRLFEFDEAVLRQHFTRPGLIVDLGAGTGRLLVPFARRGFRGLAVDLSPAMLQIVREKAERDDLPIDLLMANMVELECLRDGTADYCICMFSTLGMVRGAENRQRVLEQARRILKPGGLFGLHVHNFYFNFFDPGGCWWIVKNLMASFFRRDVEIGDKVFSYRGIPAMFLHVFRRREITAALKQAGFRVESFVPLDPMRRRPLRWPWLLGTIRANGWIAVCRSP